MLKAVTFIDSVKFVQEKIKESNKVEFKSQLISKVMRQDLRMKYKKVQAIALTANSKRSLILRQQFALAFLDIDFKKKTVLNVD